MALMGQREFSRHMDVSLRAVQKAIESGRITVDENGKIDSERAARDWVRNSDESRMSFTDLSRRRVPDVDDDSDELDDDQDLPAAGMGAADASAPPSNAKREDDAVRQYREERAKRESIRRQREEAELAEYRGSLIDVNDARRLAFTAYRTLRDAVLNVPVRVKDLVAAETDPARVEAMLERELSAALQQVTPEAILREQADEEDIDDGGS